MANAAWASPYQYEIRGSIDHYHSDTSRNAQLSAKNENDIYGITGTYYFSPVATDNVPLAQAGFMSRTNNLSLHYSHEQDEASTRFHAPNTNTIRDDYTLKSLTAMARFYWLDGWFYTSIGATESHAHYKQYERSNGSTQYIVNDKHHDHWRGQASIGVSPFAGLLIYTNVYEGTDYSDSPNLNVQYLQQIGSKALGLHVRMQDHYDNFVTHIDADYYITPRLSVGVGYEKGEDYNFDYDWSVNSRYFITTKTSLEANYKSYESGEAFVLGATTRF